jgi:hypothetical protein
VFLPNPLARVSLVLIPVVAQAIGCSAPRDPVAARSVSLTALDVGATTSPTSASAASLYLSNWTNAQNIWMASQLDQNDDGPYGPRIAEMRIADDWNTNQIVDYSDFFRDETHGIKYDQPHPFRTQAWLDEGGILRTSYVDYAGMPLPLTITKSFAMVPGQNFTVATLTFANSSGRAIDFGMLDQIHVNNKTRTGANATLHGWYDGARQALFVDMTGAGQFFVALAALDGGVAHQVADDANANTASSDVAAWYTFDQSGTVPGNDDEHASDISIAFADRFVVPAGGWVARSFVFTVQRTLADAQAAIDGARARTANAWLTQTQDSYRAWLTAPGKKTVAFADNGLDLMYTRALVTIKNSINPTSGAMPATTNPSSYSYKVWARDSAVTAMALDRAGFTAEAEAYWYWLAQRQNSDGTFGTTFNLWDSSYVPFVQPENDSLGIFLMGVWDHYRLTGNGRFLNDLWPAYERTADHLWGSIGNAPYGLGLPDFSIWEETYEYNVFSQTVYVAGMDAAQNVARAVGRTDLADAYAGVASKIRSNIQKDDTSWPAGLWNPSGYYNRAVNSDGTARTTVDGASDALLVFGVVDAQSSRAQRHASTVIADDGHDGYGIARYANDTYYATSIYSPAGNETQSDSPDWPQLSAYLALYDAYRGDQNGALAYLQWIAARSFAGYMAQGEAVSRTLLTPVVSTGVEPVTAAWFVLAALGASGQTDLRVYSPTANAGALATISVGTVASDLGQWSNVPYYTDRAGDSVSGSGDTDITRVYIANDASNLYLRIKNASGHLPSWQKAPLFTVQLYAEDFKHAGATAATGSGLFGNALPRPMQYLVSRQSDSATYQQWNVQGGSFTALGAIDGVIAPQWDPASGNIELVVPLALLSSGGDASPGDWANVVIALGTQDASGAWHEEDELALHYRVTQYGDAWFFGNLE